MNGWDLFTWIMALVLAGSAVIIFAYFLRDARGIIKQESEEPDDG